MSVHDLSKIHSDLKCAAGNAAHCHKVIKAHAAVMSLPDHAAQPVAALLQTPSASAAPKPKG